MKVKRKIIEINEKLCDGCGQCVLSCAENAIIIVDGKAKTIADNLCDGLGACIEDCPQSALKIIERKADEFSEDAVEKHLVLKQEQNHTENLMACGCPSTKIQDFKLETQSLCNHEDNFTVLKSRKSFLSHWPVKIKLIPPNASFLRRNNILVMADCVPIAYSSIHKDFLKGKSVMIGCPKFDNRNDYIKKFNHIFIENSLKKITCIIMEVPCCLKFSSILIEALNKSAKKILLEVIVITTKGKILERKIYN